MFYVYAWESRVSHTRFKLLTIYVGFPEGYSFGFRGFKSFKTIHDVKIDLLENPVDLIHVVFPASYLRDSLITNQQISFYKKILTKYHLNISSSRKRKHRKKVLETVT